MSAILLESGDRLLLESGDVALLEITDAGLAASTVTGHAASVAATAAPGTAAATATAHDAVVAGSASAGHAAATATGHNAAVTATASAGSASATATGHDATASTAAATNADAGNAAATATAYSASVAVTASAIAATVTATAHNATVAAAATIGTLAGLRDTNPVNDPAGVGPGEVARLWLDPEDDWSGDGPGQGPHTGLVGTWPNARGRTNPTPPKWMIDDSHPGQAAVPAPTRIVTVANTAALTAALAPGTLLPGDHIRLQPGVTYTGPVTVGASGTAEAPIVIEHDPTTPTEWWRTTGANPAKVTAGGFEATGKSHLVFRHLLMEDLTTDGKRGFYIIGSDPTPSTNITIYGNKVRNAENSGVALWGATHAAGVPNGNYNRLTDVVVDSNLIELSQYATNETITVSNGVVDVDVRYNILRHGVSPTGNEGIDFKNGVANGRIFGNIIYDLRLRCIYLDGGFNNNHDPAQPSVLSNIEIFGNYCLGSYHAGTGLTIGTEGVGKIDGVKVYNNIFREMGYTANGTAYSGIDIINSEEPADGREGRYRNIEIRNNTIIGCEKYGINNNRNVTGFTDTVIEGNLIQDCAGAHDILDVMDTVSTLNLARDTDGVNYVVNGDALLTAPASVTADDLLYEPPSGSIAVDPATPLPAVAWLTHDFHGRPRDAAYDYGAVEYLAVEGSGPASATASGHSPSVSVTVAAGHASATATAHDATVTAVPVVNAAAGHASATATGHDATAAATATAGSASVTATAHNATVTTSGTTNAPAGHATATATGHAASVTATATAGSATATGTAHNASVTATATAGAATATGTAHDATVEAVSNANAPAGHAAATATAHDATVETVPVVTVTAGHGSATATAYGATVATSTGATTATVTATAHNAAVTTAASTSAAAGHATATATAHDATIIVTVSAGHATATATAYDPEIPAQVVYGLAVGAVVTYPTAAAADPYPTAGETAPYPTAAAVT